MSAAAATKPPGTPRREANTRTTSSSPAAANRTPARSSTPTANGTSGVSRTRSVRGGANGTPVSARAAVKKPAASSNLSNASQPDAADDDAREEQAALLQELKDRLQKAENEAAERQKQVEILNSRLDDALAEQAKLEERAHEEEEKVESLENVKRELTRQHRELEGIYEAERAQAMKDKESTQTREEELQETIQRLKETMATKNVQGVEDGEAPLSRACKLCQSKWTFDTDTRQQASATTLHAQTPPRILRISRLLTQSSAATPATTRSSFTRRTRSSKICASNSPNTRSRCWKLRMLEVVELASWRSSFLRPA